MVCMNSSGMLTEIVETRECFTAMTREWSFSSVLPVIDISQQDIVVQNPDPDLSVLT